MKAARVQERHVYVGSVDGGGMGMVRSVVMRRGRDRILAMQIRTRIVEAGWEVRMSDSSYKKGMLGLEL